MCRSRYQYTRLEGIVCSDINIALSTGNTDCFICATVDAGGVAGGLLACLQ